MTRELFQTLIAHGEGETLDFKRDAHDLQKKGNAFIKDILAMANTPRDGDAHIVLGVGWTPESGAEIVGLSAQRDDVVFQQALSRDKVQPRPRFTYTPLEVDGKQVGIITIPRGTDGPYTALKDYEDLQAGVIYYRQGSQNDKAVGADLRRIISWFAGAGSPVSEPNHIGAWKRFRDAVEGFAPTRSYLLCSDRISALSAAPVHALAMVPWRAVIDFDPESEGDGLLSVMGGPLGTHRIIHRTVKGERNLHPEPGTHWFFARGLAGRLETLAPSDHRSWIKQYKRELGMQLGRLSAAINPTPATVLIWWHDITLRPHLRTLLEELQGSFGDSAEIVVITNEEPSFAGICEEAGAIHVRMSLRSLCAGIADHFADEQTADSERASLPTSAGAFVPIEPGDRLWLSESLDIAYRGVGTDGEDPLDAYRRGGR